FVDLGMQPGQLADMLVVVLLDFGLSGLSRLQSSHHSISHRTASNVDLVLAATSLSSDLLGHIGGIVQRAAGAKLTGNLFEDLSPQIGIIRSSHLVVATVPSGAGGRIIDLLLSLRLDRINIAVQSDTILRRNRGCTGGQGLGDILLVPLIHHDLDVIETSLVPGSINAGTDGGDELTVLLGQLEETGLDLVQNALGDLNRLLHELLQLGDRVAEHALAD